MVVCWLLVVGVYSLFISSDVFFFHISCVFCTVHTVMKLHVQQIIILSLIRYGITVSKYLPYKYCIIYRFMYCKIDLYVV